MAVLKFCTTLISPSPTKGAISKASQVTGIIPNKDLSILDMVNRELLIIKPHFCVSGETKTIDIDLYYDILLASQEGWHEKKDAPLLFNFYLLRRSLLL